MRRCVATVVFGLAGIACLAEQPEAELGDSALGMLQDVEDRDYRQWPRPPDDGERRRADSPHGPFVATYIDPQLTESLAVEEGLEEWPVGVTAVNEGWTKRNGGDLRIVSIVEKTDDGFEWAQIVQGSVVASGQPASCISCHGGGDDFLMTVLLPLPAEDED